MERGLRGAFRLPRNLLALVRRQEYFLAKLIPISDRRNNVSI